jgi:hypothetical protein
MLRVSALNSAQKNQMIAEITTIKPSAASTELDRSRCKLSVAKRLIIENIAEGF